MLALPPTFLVPATPLYIYMIKRMLYDVVTVVYTGHNMQVLQHSISIFKLYYNSLQILLEYSIGMHAAVQQPLVITLFNHLTNHPCFAPTPIVLLYIATCNEWFFYIWSIA